MRFAQATELVERGDGGYTARLAPGWDAFGVANGGYLLTLAAKAALVTTGRDDPITVTAHYLGPGRSGTNVDVNARVLKSGRQFATAAVDVTSAGAPTISALVTCGVAGAQGVELGPPDLPPPEDCVLLVPGDPLPPPMSSQVETRIHPDDAFTARGPSGHARVRGWFRLRDDEPLTTLAALLATDTWPPPIVVAKGVAGWIATVELSVQIRSRPQGEWLACLFDNNVIAGGSVSWDGTITDEWGRLVATCRQLALMPRS